MPGDDSSRMYSRLSGGRRKPSLSTPERSSAPTTPVSPASVQPPPDHVVSETLYEQYHDQMGVSSHTLRAMFSKMELSSLKGLENNMARAQLARVATYGPRRSREMEKEIDLLHCNELEGAQLKFALTMKPVDILLETVGANNDDAEMRQLKKLIDEDMLEEADLPDDEQLAEMLSLYQEVVKGDLALMSGTGGKDRETQIREIASTAKTCLDKMRSMVSENAAKTAENMSNDRITRAKIVSENGDKPKSQRITADTMKTYKSERDS